MDWSWAAEKGVLFICLCGLAWYIIRRDKEHREDIRELREEQNDLRREHKEETSRLTECFDSLKDTIRDLIEEIRDSRRKTK